jgi:signal transduction histidine kinase
VTFRLSNLRAGTIGILMVVLAAATLYFLYLRRSQHDVLAIMTHLQTLSQADRAMNQAGLELTHGTSLQFDDLNRAAASMRTGLEELRHYEETVSTHEPHFGAALDSFGLLVERKENAAFSLTSRSGALQNTQRTVARLLSEPVNGCDLHDVDGIPELATALLTFRLSPNPTSAQWVERANDATARAAQHARGPCRDVVEMLAAHTKAMVTEMPLLAADLAELLTVPTQNGIARLEDARATFEIKERMEEHWFAMIGVFLAVLGGLGVYVLIGRVEASSELVRRTNQHLEQLVADRTAELRTANQQLAADIERRIVAEHERDLMFTHLQQASKLESVGRLAAGIAHELNTPAQFVGDNTRFLRKAFEGMVRPLSDLNATLTGVAANADPSEDGDESRRLTRAREIVSQVDVGFLTQEVPLAIDESLDGINRISEIVLSMREFSHPSLEKSQADINRAIMSTVTVARNEWKYVADLHTTLDPTLPLVNCIAGSINQVLLNLIVNASQAIAKRLGSNPAEKGTIAIATRNLGDRVEIRITDSGCGVPAAIRDKIFDPFFTTKNVGEGTGQGLHIARTVIVEGHGGTIALDPSVTDGAAFVITLPVGEAAAVEPVAGGMNSTSTDEH